MLWTTWIGAALAASILLTNYFVKRQSQRFKQMILIFGLISVGLTVVDQLQSTARVDELYEPRWPSLTADQISMIVPSVVGTRPAKPMMTIQYLGDNARDLALSLKELFSKIGFNPEIRLDNRLPPGDGTIKIDADDSDKEMLTIIIKRMESITEGRIICELTSSKGQGQTIIRIGMKQGN